jgi:transposase-like protein
MTAVERMDDDTVHTNCPLCDQPIWQRNRLDTYRWWCHECDRVVELP